MTAKPKTETRYRAQFVGANGKTRYVGEGATMPFDKEHARAFETRAEAKAALAAIHSAHKSGYGETVQPFKCVISKPAYMIAMGL